MTGRSYGQFCGLSRAMETVGERWALLIVRDLLVGPRRFTDLRRGLPRIPTNILSARLKELELAGVVHRRVLPRPATSVVYELTPYGHALEDVVLRLGLWGAMAMGDPEPGEIATVDSLTMALRSTFDAEAAAGLRVSYEFRLGDLVVSAVVDDGTLDVVQGPLPEADLVVETGAQLRALMAGELAPAEAVGTGLVTLTGDPTELDRLVQVFRIPPMPS
ncbi:winged helix-turn-helix transcriptional regulator [Sphaerisporangium rubeum]|uniref:DNA-binding HxlR family transcriptional regulator n=1 Tax=Sphaerisporangium rubeum TaxID=321317 RepID=A0A7X0M860_9ACTN|nr:helix-turn-helix domain-containing protein [Sphaerisporangium rubeum]MBB6473734.1 DNA-binding HxlR family transcriptional regulator [Sphaerisporangium rubeum]